MQYLEDFIHAADGHEIPVRLWRPIHVKKILVIVHGMAEYCERYAPLADWLTEADIAVVAMNHRGHGMDCPDEDLGFFASDNGWSKVVNDLEQVIQFIQSEIPATPITLFGHSMGSFICQSYLQRPSPIIQQVILGSTNGVNRLKLTVSLGIIKTLERFKGERGVSPLIDFLSFGLFNRSFRPNRTEYDWLNRDDDHVDAYINDPYCGFSCTLKFWQDFIEGMLSISPDLWPTSVPIHVLSGTNDPVGEFTHGVTKFVNQLKANDQPIKTFKLYRNARHELTNELNFEEVWQDIKNITLVGSIEEPY